MEFLKVRCIGPRRSGKIILKLIMKRRSGYLFNMALPLCFIEWWFVRIALIFIIIIETYIVHLFLKKEIVRTFKILFLANLLTTIIGYLTQGIIRVFLATAFFFLSLRFKMLDDVIMHPVIQGVFAGVVPVKGGGKSEFTPDVIIAILTSIFLTFLISLIVERKILISKLGMEFEKKLISKAIIIANIISYILLSIWIFYGYSTLSF